MNHIEKFMNFLTDSDWGWQPFVFLKPAKTKKMTNTFLLKISIIYVTPIVLLMGIYIFSIGLRPNIPFLLYTDILFTVIFFILYKITFAFFWNRQVKRLNKK